MRVRVTIVVLWILSLGMIAAFASPQGRLAGERVVISGNDIGFRLEGSQANGARGTLVVRVNGQWVEAQFVSRPVPATRGGTR